MRSDEWEIMDIAVAIAAGLLMLWFTLKCVFV